MSKLSKSVIQLRLCVGLRFCFFPSDIAGEIGFQFDRETFTFNDDLQADCVVATQAGVGNPRADITWLGPDGSVYNSSQGVPFETVTRQGVVQQEARLPLSFRPFGPGDAAEYSCLATITSDDFPGSETQVFRTVEIPGRGKPRHSDCIEEFLLYWFFFLQLIHPRSQSQCTQVRRTMFLWQAKSTPLTAAYSLLGFP